MLPVGTGKQAPATPRHGSFSLWSLNKSEALTTVSQGTGLRSLGAQGHRPPMLVLQGSQCLQNPGKPLSRVPEMQTNMDRQGVEGLLCLPEMRSS